MNGPLIDVIIAVYNGELFLQEAVESVQAQSWKNLKIIIMDDGSTDGTEKIAQALARQDERITVLRQEHFGVSKALNASISVSTADYIAFLDADDLWAPLKLEKQMNELAAADADHCICLVLEFESFDKGGMRPAKHKARKMPMKGYLKTAFLAKKHIFKEFGLFNESISTGDFIEWLSRLIRADRKALILNEVLAYRRVHYRNMTSNINKNDYLEILKQHLDQKGKID